MLDFEFQKFEIWVENVFNGLKFQSYFFLSLINLVNCFVKLYYKEFDESIEELKK